MPEQWRSDEVLAWTQREGPPGPPTAGHPVLWTALAAVLATAFVGMVSTDALCPEHRAWVEGLGIGGFVTIVVAAVGLVRRSAWAPYLTAVACTLGIAIGVLDATHDATRGRVIALAFGVVLVATGVLIAHTSRLRAWDRQVGAAVAPLPAMSQPIERPSVEPEPVDGAPVESRRSLPR